MNGYEFMGDHPFLTIILVAIGCNTFSECIKYMFLGIRGETSEQENQEKES